MDKRNIHHVKYSGIADWMVLLGDEFRQKPFLKSQNENPAILQLMSHTDVTGRTVMEPGLLPLAKIPKPRWEFSAFHRHCAWQLVCIRIPFENSSSVQTCRIFCWRWANTFVIEHICPYVQIYLKQWTTGLYYSQWEQIIPPPLLSTAAVTWQWAAGSDRLQLQRGSDVW